MIDGSESARLWSKIGADAAASDDGQGSQAQSTQIHGWVTPVRSR